MRTKIFMLCVSLVLFTTNINAQWAVFDPSNLAQGIVNTTRNVVQTTTTATNMVNNFKEVQKVYNQGKEYYDALKAVNNLVKDAKKVQQGHRLFIYNFNDNKHEKICIIFYIRDTDCLYRMCL